MQNYLYFNRKKIFTISFLSFILVFFSYQLSGEKINLIDDYTILKLDVSDGLNSNRVNSVFQSKDGYIWLYNDNGFTKFDGVKFVFFNKINNKIPVLEFESLNKEINKKKVLFKKLKKKIVRDYKIKNIDILSILEDNKKIWIGTKGDGLYILNLDLSNTLDNISFPIIENDYINDIMKDSEGNIWLATSSNGLIRIKNKYIQSNESSPIIENVIMNNINISNLDNPVINETGFLEFHFTGLHFSAPDKLRFRYKLEGYDSKWKFIQPGFNRLKIYINLEPGKYLFLLQTGISKFKWSKAIAKYNFSIKNHKLNYYIVFIIFILLSITLFYIFIKIKRKKTKNIINKDKHKKYQTSGLNDEFANTILKKLLSFMENGTPYLEPSLNLKKLSEILQIQYNHLSQIINEKLNQNSNDFINKYRVEEAKKMLIKDKDISVLDIAYECGFYSKSVFNTAFKKFTGLTPSQFRKNS